MLAAVVVGMTLATAACELDTTDPIAQEPMTLVGADRQGRVWVVEETSGTLALVDTVFVQHPENPLFISPVGAIASMTWVPSIDTWWVATSRGSAPCANCIYAYDPRFPWARNFRRNIGDVDSIADFAEDPENGRLYTFPVEWGGSFYRVDPRSGEYHVSYLPLDEGASGKGTTFGTDGLLYVAGGLLQQHLVRIDLNGSAIEVGPLTYVGFPPFTSYSVTLQAMATRASDGVVFALVQDGGGWAGTISATFLGTVDLATAIVTNVGATTERLNALAYVPTRLLP
jgi:hypothetical protein